MMIDEALLSSAVEIIVERMKPERIILFGSQERGTSDERSDVDLLVISRFTGKRRERIAELYGALIYSGFAQDIILMTPEELRANGRSPERSPARLPGKGK